VPRPSSESVHLFIRLRLGSASPTTNVPFALGRGAAPGQHVSHLYGPKRLVAN
jgi:hypothetical protein